MQPVPDACAAPLGGAKAAPPAPPCLVTASSLLPSLSLPLVSTPRRLSLARLPLGGVPPQRIVLVEASWGCSARECVWVRGVCVCV